MYRARGAGRQSVEEDSASASATSFSLSPRMLERALAAARANRQSVLVTVRRDGRPQLSNVVHLVGDDGLVRVSTTADRAKAHNLRRTPWAALKVDGESFWSYAVLEGDVTLSEVAADPADAAVDELVALYRGISG